MSDTDNTSNDHINETTPQNIIWQDSISIDHIRQRPYKTGAISFDFTLEDNANNNYIGAFYKFYDDMTLSFVITSNSVEISNEETKIYKADIEIDADEEYSAEFRVGVDKATWDIVVTGRIWEGSEGDEDEDGSEEAMWDDEGAGLIPLTGVEPALTTTSSLRLYQLGYSGLKCLRHYTPKTHSGLTRHVFRCINNQFFQGYTQLIGQTFKDIRPRHETFFLNSLDSNGGDLGIFSQFLYRQPTALTPISQQHLQVLFIFHKFLLTESQHGSKSILAHLVLFYHTLANLLLFCYNSASNRIVNERQAKGMAGYTKYTRETVEEAVLHSKSYADVLRYLGKRQAGGSLSYIKVVITKFGIDVSHFSGQGWRRNQTFPEKRKKPEEILVLQDILQPRARAAYLRRALEAIGRPYKCSACGISRWQGKEITLEIDHINGNTLDNREQNLRFLCPNCHSQTENYNGRNIKAKREAEEQRQIKKQQTEERRRLRKQEAMLRSDAQAADRFWPKVDKSGDCWLWTATNAGNAGYGRFKYHGKLESAHWMAWVLTHGNPPANTAVGHTCGNRTCVNPDHLQLRKRGIAI